MDLSNYLSMKRRIDLPWEERYIPVTIHNEIKDLIDETQSTRIIDDDEPLQIGWMGRLDNDKIYSILNAADNLIGIQNGRKGNCITMSWETLIFFLSIEKRKRKKKSFEAYKSICMKKGQTLEYKTILFHVS